MRKRQRLKGQVNCAYCGLKLATTMDHVIPQCLFLPPLPEVMVTVPACDDCNNSKSKNDDYLRDFLVTDVYCSEHPVAKNLAAGKVARSAQKNRSRLARAAKTGAKWAPVYTPAGLYLGHAYSVPLEGERINEIFRTIVRGLYYWMGQGKERLPDDYVTEIRRVNDFNVREVVRGFQTVKAHGPYSLSNVFTFMATRTVEYPAVTAWLLGFYDGVYIFASTEPSGGIATTP